ncbi:MAG: UDP-4-amino-4,6-dideoxy-N-acetyl-beta-L-altrosamine transaminase [Kiloniellales bacterium]|nr:UDP-4-amino-4,6-dideoxy-N-acetyl-beta-L-altrosamine transaminase [Kiloniellales bacterium]
MKPKGAGAAAAGPPREGGVLPYGRQAIDEDDIARVAEVLRSDYLTTGPQVEAFESAFRSAVGADHAVACANGTAALHLAMMALGLSPGEVCIVPAITFVATANAARMVGAEVVFSDVDPETGLMRPEDLEAALVRADRGAVRLAAPVHLAGQTADLEGMAALAGSRGVRLIEDACHALGTRARAGDGRMTAVGACALTEAATFSFHPVKTIACGEGGMVTTRDAAVARRMRRLRSHGIERDPESFRQDALAFGPGGLANPWYHEMQDLGYNHRLSDIHCALGISQLGKLARFVAARRDLVAHYDRLLAGYAPRLRPIGRVPGCEAGWHLYVVLIDFDALETDRASVMRRLAERGVGSQVHYVPVYRQPYYEARYGAQSLPGAEAYYARALSLPLFFGMGRSDVERVVEALAEVLGMEGTG